MAVCMPGSAQPEEPVCLGKEMLVTGLVQSVTGAGRGLGTDLRVLALSVGWWPQAALLGQGGRGTLLGWTWVHVAVGETETMLVGAWLGVDQREAPCSFLGEPKALLLAYPRCSGCCGLSLGRLDGLQEGHAYLASRPMPTWHGHPELEQDSHSQQS